jgi:di/tricarboxylate transporter
MHYDPKQLGHSTFFSISIMTDSVRQWWSGIVLVMIILCDTLGWMNLLTVACLGVASLLLLRTITVDEALRATRPRILIMIAASFALGSALQNTGVATWVAKSLVDITTSSGRFGLLLGVSIATSLINALVSNNACMVLMFPVCVTVSANSPTQVSINFVVCRIDFVWMHSTRYCAFGNHDPPM